MKEALFYEGFGREGVRCTLCPHVCRIAEGEVGLCGVRKNIGGRLYALTYQRVAAIAVDPIEKKPLYHFYPGSAVYSIGTFGCNLRCKHCQNWKLSHGEADSEGANLTILPPAELVSSARSRGCNSIAWTYNEPSIWFEYVLEGARLAHQAGLHTILVTSGMINPKPLKLLIREIDAYRLDVKGFTEELYVRLTGSRVLGRVLENAVIAREAGAHLEIVTNVIPNWNDADEDLAGLSKWIADDLGADTPWHVTAYHPAHQVREPPTPRATLERAGAIGASSGLSYVYVGNIPGHPGQNTLCPECGRTLIDRTGPRARKQYLASGKCEYCGHAIGNYYDSEAPFERNEMEKT